MLEISFVLSLYPIGLLFTPITAATKLLPILYALYTFGKCYSVPSQSSPFETKELLFFVSQGFQMSEHISRLSSSSPSQSTYFLHCDAESWTLISEYVAQGISLKCLASISTIIPCSQSVWVVFFLLLVRVFWGGFIYIFIFNSMIQVYLITAI